MRPKLSEGIKAMDTHGQGFIEGNSWNYRLYVPQHPSETIAMICGKKNTVPLDSLFIMELPDKYFVQTEDIIRKYVHGNEPSHQVAYLYNWTDST